MKKLFFMLGLCLGAVNLFAQGPKWSLSGNSISSGEFLGTTNAQPLIFKVNNVPYLNISTSGAYTFNGLTGTGNGLFMINASGLLSRLNFPGGTGSYLQSDGTFAPITSGAGWNTSTGISWTNNKVGIGVPSPSNTFEVQGNSLFNGIVAADEFQAGNVVNSGQQLRIQSSLCLKGYNTTIPGSRSEVCGMGHDFYIQSTTGLNNHTILNFSNAGNVGIGTDHPTAKLEVAGDVKISGELNFSSFSLGAVKAKYTAVSGGSVSGIFLMSIDPLAIPRPAPPCLSPSIPFLHQVEGLYHSWGTNAFGGGINDMTMGFDGANGIIDVAGNSDYPGAPALLLNYYCGKNVAICTGGFGGNIYMSTGDPATIVGIGTNCIPTGYKLGVNGRIICNGVKVQLVDGSGCWPDYVFDADYKMMDLLETEQYIKKYKHLPNVPSAKEIEKNGIDLVETNKLLLEKLEEMTLQMIEMKKEIEILKSAK